MSLDEQLRRRFQEVPEPVLDLDADLEAVRSRARRLRARRRWAGIVAGAAAVVAAVLAVASVGSLRDDGSEVDVRTGGGTSTLAPTTSPAGPGVFATGTSGEYRYELVSDADPPRVTLRLDGEPVASQAVESGAPSGVQPGWSPLPGVESRWVVWGSAPSSGAQVRLRLEDGRFVTALLHPRTPGGPDAWFVAVTDAPPDSAAAAEILDAGGQRLPSGPASR